MMKFRRSMKNEKHDSAKPVQANLQPKDAIAIEPPKKVIKALYDYQAPPDAHIYLSFTAGDFLHVVGREHDPDWYEACNPLRNERGLVPVKYFENVGKTVRDSGDSSQSLTSTTHDSGYGEGHTPPAHASHPSASGGPAAPRMSAAAAAGHRPSKSFGKLGGVYGVVVYDFKAERPDELEAKAGEAIIVIAQSNPEWFVAKPITRLGGPGLIPVAFIEIHDMTTGKPVPDALAAVQKAGIPRVEEWKKMAAEYKNTSIPLGTVSSSAPMQPGGGGGGGGGDQSQPSQGYNGLQQGMDRMSLSNHASGSSNPYGHQRAPSRAAQPQQPQQISPNSMPATRASVPRFIYADDKFHFVVEAEMSNGAHWDLSRIYEDFYELQISLIAAFPAEAGQVPGRPRILPYMPGPVKFVTDNISEGRRVNLDEYLRDLLRLPPHIAAAPLVRQFFAPRDGDYEVDPTEVDFNEHARPVEARDRYSHASQHSAAAAYASAPQPAGRQMSAPPGPSAAASANGGQNGQGPAGPAHYSYSQAQGPGGAAYGHQRGQPSQTSQFPTPPSNNAPNAAAPNAAAPAAASSSIPPISTSTAPLKIKCWFDRDTCVVIRMPPPTQITLDQLWAKVLERRRLEFKDRAVDAAEEQRLDMEYRDEASGSYYRIDGEQDLQIAVAAHPEKLTIAVRDPGREG